MRRNNPPSRRVSWGPRRAVISIVLLFISIFLLLFAPSPGLGEQNGAWNQATTIITVPPTATIVGDIPDGQRVIIYAEQEGGLSERSELVCSGKNDQQLINRVLSQMRDRGGGTVVLSEGRFTCSGDIEIPGNVHLTGAGQVSTELRFEARGRVNLEERGSSLEGCTVTGSGMVLVTSSEISVRNVSATSDAREWATFGVEAPKQGTISGISFVDCAAVNSETSGFMISSQDGSGTVRDGEFVRCQALNCGRERRFNEYVVGFSLAEKAHITNITVLQCRAEGSWESGFHVEGEPVKDRVHLIDCISIRNGQKGGTGVKPDFGAGFLVSTGMKLVGCRSIANEIGYLCIIGDAVLINCEDDSSKTGMLIKEINAPAGFEVVGGRLLGSNLPIRIESRGGPFTSTVIRQIAIAGTGATTEPAIVVEDVPNPDQISIIDSTISGYPIGIADSEAGPIVRRNVTINGARPSDTQRATTR